MNEIIKHLLPHSVSIAAILYGGAWHNKALKPSMNISGY